MTENTVGVSQMATYSLSQLLLNVVNYIGNRVPFGIHTVCFGVKTISVFLELSLACIFLWNLAKTLSAVATITSRHTH